MKYCLLVLLVLLGTTCCLAQTPDTAAVRIERLPPSGLLLQKGWRYHPGDDPAWARPDFDDSRWDTLNPTRPRRELPPRLSSGISWLRLHFRLGDSLRRQVLLLRPNANAAFELYLDGQLLHRDGYLHPDPRRVQVNVNTTVSLDLAGLGRAPHLLAVRFAPMHYPAWVLGADISPPLFCRLFTEPQIRRQAAEQAQMGARNLMVAGVFGLLTLLHLVFFRYNPARRANLYFALYAGSTALAFWLRAYLGTGDTNFSSLGQSIVAQILAIGLQLLSYLWAVRALYALYGYRPGRLYYGLWVVGGLALTWGSLYLFGTIVVASAAVVFVGLAIGELLRLTIKAGRERQRGVSIIGTGFAVGLLSLFADIALSVAGAFTFTYALFLLSCLAPALSISLFLAREFALDAQLLLGKLTEVQQLSAQTLAQEQEKQVLLAQQNETLETQVSQRTGELQRSLTDLRATQAQLIQKEKMASLGELTAGIAHEIQNPLNFVNNFSEVSAELVAELREERAKGTAADTELEEDLLTDLNQNLTKITQHGQRAASIVRGMLEHSRVSSGERQLIDVNALCDEYLRLAYHGLRAKDKAFNAELKTTFAPDLPLVQGVGADLGRVLLNLFNNAFYAMQQRQLANGQLGYEPMVSVQTECVGKQVQIRVFDNGTGMSAAVQQKIFQPFFTTKPTGEGTGLGLSLSHDIIAQGHGGTLRVESHEGQGTKFLITLPS